MPDASVSPEFEMVDLGFRIRDRRIGIGPCEADLEHGKHHPVDHNGIQIRAPDPGVPQAPSGLEGLDSKSVIVALHLVTPPIWDTIRECGPKNGCEPGHI